MKDLLLQKGKAASAITNSAAATSKIEDDKKDGKQGPKSRKRLKLQVIVLSELKI
jgi:hypothetical protein